MRKAGPCVVARQWRRMRRKEGLFAADVDGTLITDSGDITDKVYTSIEKAVAHNWEFVIASGRTYYAAKKIMDRFPFLNYAILSNGGCIFDTVKKEIVHIEKISPETALEIIGKSREYGIIPALYTTALADQIIYYDSIGKANYFSQWFFSEDERCVKVGDVTDYIDDVLQIGMIGEAEAVMRLKDALAGVAARVTAMPFESPRFGGKRMDYWFLHAVGENATKHNAIKKMAGILDIPLDRTVAAGDNYNDAEMINGAALGIAMGNSPDEIKKIAGMVVGTNNESGLSEGIEEAIFSGKYFPEPGSYKGCRDCFEKV